MFIQTETTPNPATLKFIPGRPVMGAAEPIDLRRPDLAEVSPLAKRLFAVPGVGGVFLGSDFVAVTRADPPWEHLKPAVLGAIMEHFLSGDPVVGAGGAAADAEDFDPEDAEVVEAIKDLIETRVRPAVAADGGDITFRGFRAGVLSLEMKGACAGCPSSTATLKNGIEGLMRHYVPEVEAVEAVEAV